MDEMDKGRLTAGMLYKRLAELNESIQNDTDIITDLKIQISKIEKGMLAGKLKRLNIENEVKRLFRLDQPEPEED